MQESDLEAVIRKALLEVNDKGEVRCWSDDIYTLSAHVAQRVMEGGLKCPSCELVGGHVLGCPLQDRYQGG